VSDLKRNVDSAYVYIVLSAMLVLTICRRSSASQSPGYGGYPATTISQELYPRVFFFRSSEQPGKNLRLTYEDWEATFERLMGIMGKVQDEEIPGLSSRNIDFFTRFKIRHRNQVVLMHYTRSPVRFRCILFGPLDLLQRLQDCGRRPGQAR